MLGCKLHDNMGTRRCRGTQMVAPKLPLANEAKNSTFQVEDKCEGYFNMAEDGYNDQKKVHGLNNDQFKPQKLNQL